MAAAASLTCRMMRNVTAVATVRFSLWLKFAMACWLVCTMPANAEMIAVVTQNGTPVTSLSKQEVANLFLGKHALTVGGQNLIPVDIADERLREAFYQSVAEMSAARVNAYWARLVFSAQGRPPRKLPLAEAKALILSQPGLVTYLPASGGGEFIVLLRLP